jgi:hypothetical protein
MPEFILTKVKRTILTRSDSSVDSQEVTFHCQKPQLFQAPYPKSAAYETSEMESQIK